jgi:DNA (cytosine-5)-methyltransferase 1
MFWVGYIGSMSKVYYNEFDPYVASLLRDLIRQGLIAYGDVDDRSIEDVQPEDLAGYTQCHFFAGIGGWSYALRLAGWPDERPVWTGSPPCQPFSGAGKKAGMSDQRHLWPHFYRLISACKPITIFGEQVEAAIGHGWLDRVQDDLERENYAFGAVDLPAASVGAPHIRQRLWFIAQRDGLVNSERERGCGGEFEGKNAIYVDAPGENEGSGRGGAWMATEPEPRPLVDGVSARMGRSSVGGNSSAKKIRKISRAGILKGYGNAIVPQVAAEVIKAYLYLYP